MLMSDTCEKSLIKLHYNLLLHNLHFYSETRKSPVNEVGNVKKVII